MSTTDAEARRRIREDLDTSLLVEAAAGTGKTTETVHRIVASVAAGRVEAPGLVALSFTRKAAGELSLRLRRALERGARARGGVEGRRLRDASIHLDEAHIGTIHGFCAELLRRHPVEAGVDPEFERLDEGGAEALFEEVFRSWFEARSQDPPPAFRRALAHGQTWAWNDQGPWQKLMGAAKKLVEHRRYPASWPHSGAEWRGPVRGMADQAAALGRAYALRDAARAEQLTKKRLDPLIEFGARAGERGLEDWAPEALEATLGRVLAFDDPPKRGTIGDRPAAELAQEALRLRSEWAELRSALEPDFASELRDLLWEVVELYEARKRRLGQLDFQDLLMRSRALLDGDTVRDRVRQELQLIFVDEFQDTDPEQARIVERLARIDEGGLFLVGDPKQSIFGFRNADMSFYLLFAAELEAKGVPRLKLTHSFRAVGPLQSFVNAAFRDPFDDDPTQPDYVPLSGGEAPGGDGPPPVAAFTPGRQPKAALPYKRARPISGLTTARLIEWILEESSWKVRDPDRGERVDVRPEHIAVLVRQMSERAEPDAWVRSLMRELERRHVPCLLHNRRYLDDRSDVAGLIACLRAIEWPNDPFWMYAALRSPLFHFTDESLAYWMAFSGPLHPSTEGDGEAELVEALRLFDELSRERNARPVSATIQALLTATRAVAGFAHEHTGPESVAAVRGLLDLAEQHERTQQSAFRTFVEKLEGINARSLAEQQLEASGVRVLNIHQAKGLEFPIVILGDPFNERRPSQERERLIEGEAAYFELLGLRPRPLVEGPPEEEPGEALRVAYVAATRARECLIVASKAAGPFRNPAWFDPIEAAVVPEPGAAVEASEHWPEGEPCCEVAQGRSPFLSGRQLSRSGETVDWMPSRIFERSFAHHPIMRRVEALKEGPAGDEATARHLAWQKTRATRLGRGRARSVVLLRPSDVEDEPRLGLARRVRVARVDREPGRPTGRRFGHLVHEVLRHAFRSPLEDAIAAAAGQIDASLEEQDAARVAVERALAEPLLVQAAASDARQEELPVCRSSDEGLLLDGVVDLFFRDEDGRGVVLDYKTHEELDEAEAKRQIAWYLWALEPTHGAGLRGVVFVL